MDLYNNNYVLGDFLQNGLNMGPDSSGMPLEHSQTLLDHFWKNDVFINRFETCPENHETQTGRETTLFRELMTKKNMRIVTIRISAVR